MSHFRLPRAVFCLGSRIIILSVGCKRLNEVISTLYFTPFHLCMRCASVRHIREETLFAYA